MPLCRRILWLCLSSLLLGACVSSSSEVTAQDRERLRAYILDQEPEDIPHRLDVNFDDRITLLGYRLNPASPLRPGQRLKLTLYWKSVAPAGPGWNLFTHVLDGSGERILNIDNVGPLREWRKNRQAMWPTAWTVGKVYVDEQDFTVPATVRTEKVQLVTGLWKGDQRMPIKAGPKDGEGRAVVATLVVGKSLGSKASRSTRVPRLRVDRLPKESAIVIDGKLDEEAWKSAASTGPLVNVATGERNTSRDLGGRVKLLYSTTSLFLAFDVEDATITGGFKPDEKDPHLWTKDTIEIMVDPDGDGDNRDYYEIQINPQNLVFDSRFDHYNEPRVEPNGPFGHQDWSANIESAVELRGTMDRDDDRDRGYVVEARIPWSAFDRARHSPPQVGDSWRMNFYIMQNNSGVAWSPILGQGNFHKASRFGRVLWAEQGWQAPYAGRHAPTRLPPNARTLASARTVERASSPPRALPRPSPSATHR